MPARDRAVYLTAEAVPGTEETPIAVTDVVDYHRWKIGPPGGRLQARPNVRPYQDRPAKKTGHGRWFPHDFEMEVKASTGATTPPEIANVLKANGFSETIGAADVAYALLDDPNSAANDFGLTITKEMTADGLQIVSYGARGGGLVFDSDGEGQLVLTGRMLGSYSRPTDQGAPTGATYNTGTPLVALDATTPIALYGGYTSAIVKNVRLAINNDVRRRINMANSSDHYHQWPALVVRDPESYAEIEVLMELVDATAHDVHQIWEDAVADATNRSVIWTAGSRKMTASLEGMQYDAPEIQEDTPNLFLIRGSLSYDEAGSNPSVTITFS